MYDELVKRLRNAAHLADKGLVILPSVCLDAADAIEELSVVVRAQKAVLEKFPKWIPVTERLPEEDTDVLVVMKFLGVKGQVPPSTYVEIASRIGDDWCAASDEYKIARSKHTDPLFWMPLPEPPKEE